MAQSIRSNFMWNASYQVLLIIAPVITIPYVSRVLGAEQVGLYSYTYSVAYYFVLFAKLGMDQYGVRLISMAGDNRLERTNSFWSAWASQLCGSSVIILAYFLYSIENPTGGTTIALLWGLWVVSAALDVSWLFFGVEDFKAPTIRNFITKIGGILVILMFCKGRGDLWAYVLGMSASYFANAVAILPFIGRYVDFMIPKWNDVKRHIVPNIRLFAPVVAVSIYMQLNKIILGNLSDMSQAGYYEYADKIARMPLTIVTALCTVMLPHMTAKIASGERRGAIELLGKALWFVLAVAIGVAFGIAAVTPELVPVFLGEGYESCVYIIPVVAIALPLISASNVIGMQYMLPSNEDVAYTKSVWIGALINVAVCVATIPRLGALGASIATVAAEGAVLLVQALAVKEDLPIKKYAVDALPFVCIGIITYLITRIVSCVLVDALGMGWHLLVAEVILAVAVYGAASLMWSRASGHFDDLKLFFQKP